MPRRVHPLLNPFSRARLNGARAHAKRKTHRVSAYERSFYTLADFPRHLACWERFETELNRLAKSFERQGTLSAVDRHSLKQAIHLLEDLEKSTR